MKSLLLFIRWINLTPKKIRNEIICKRKQVQVAPRIEFGSQLSWLRHATDSKGEFINVEGSKG